MNSFKKKYRHNTFFIDGGIELEKFREELIKNGLSGVNLGYDTTYDNDKVVNTGYMHYDKGFFLSKHSFDKVILVEL
jgi:hypothetical protein